VAVLVRAGVKSYEICGGQSATGRVLLSKAIFPVMQFIVKNGVFWDVTPCGSCKNRCFGGT
jgi:hypothetical protein